MHYLVHTNRTSVRASTGNVRTIRITDAQLALIADALALYASTMQHPPCKEEALWLHACCTNTIAEPDDKDMVHGFAL